MPEFIWVDFPRSCMKGWKNGNMNSIKSKILKDIGVVPCGIEVMKGYTRDGFIHVRYDVYFVVSEKDNLYAYRRIHTLCSKNRYLNIVDYYDWIAKGHERDYIDI